MTKVRVEPSGVTFDVDDSVGESIFHAAIRQGYSWPTVCGGQGSCTACALEVLAGEEHLLPAEASETERLNETSVTIRGDRSSCRLACQAKPSGDVTVGKRGVRQRSSSP